MKKLFLYKSLLMIICLLGAAACGDGKKKEEALDAFYKKVLKEAISDLSKELRNSMEKQTDNVEDKIQQRIDSIVEICETKSDEFERIQKVKESDEAKMESEQYSLLLTKVQKYPIYLQHLQLSL